MSRPNTPPAGSASGSHGLPAGAWSTRQHTTPHTPRPPAPRAPHTQASPSRVCHRGGTGAVNSPAGLGTGQPRFAQPSRVGTKASADRGPGRPAQALTQTKPNPPKGAVGGASSEGLAGGPSMTPGALEAVCHIYSGPLQCFGGGGGSVGSPDPYSLQRCVYSHPLGRPAGPPRLPPPPPPRERRDNCSRGRIYTAHGSDGHRMKGPAEATTHQTEHRGDGGGGGATRTCHHNGPSPNPSLADGRLRGHPLNSGLSVRKRSAQTAPWGPLKVAAQQTSPPNVRATGPKRGKHRRTRGKAGDLGAGHCRRPRGEGAGGGGGGWGPGRPPAPSTTEKVFLG